MSDTKLVWSDEKGDLRKNKDLNSETKTVDNSQIILKIRKLTAGKGRAVFEISGLPKNADWCKALASDLKKSLGVGGAYKNDFIEVHTDNFEKLVALLEKKQLKYKKTGG